jgi:outer membrane protein assembly factor BamE
MQKLIILVVSSLLITACSIIPVHKMDIQQGNVITPEMTHRLHTGMSESQVKEVMGTPMVLNTFNDNRIDYVYTFKPGGKKMTEKKITLMFRNGILQNISEDNY